MRRWTVKAIAVSIGEILAVFVSRTGNRIADSPDPNFRRVYLSFGGRNGIGPGSIVVLGKTAYTVNQRNCTISAMDLDTGRIRRWTTFQMPAVGHYPYVSPYVVCEREVLMATDGRWLYLAATNEIYCYDPRTLKRVAARQYPMRGTLISNLRGIRQVVSPRELVWLPEQKRLCIRLAGTYEGVRDIGWSSLCHLKPRSLRVTKLVHLDSKSLKSSWRPGSRSGPFTFSGNYKSTSRFIVDMATGAATPMPVTRSSFMASGCTTMGRPARLFQFHGNRYVNGEWVSTPMLSITDPATGISQGPLMLDPLPEPLLSVHRAEMIADPSGWRMLITAQCNYLNRVGLALVDVNGRQISPWYALPGLCQLGGIYVDWRAERAYISDDRTNSIRILSLKPLKQIRQIPVGAHIAGIWFDNGTGKLMARGWMTGQYIWTVDTGRGRLTEAVNLHEERYLNPGGLAKGHLMADLQDRSVYVVRSGHFHDLPGYVRTGQEEGGPHARIYYWRYEKYDLRSGKLEAEIDAGAATYDGYVADPTLIPSGPMDRLRDPARRRLYRPRSSYTTKGQPAAVEAWDTEKHAKVGEFALPADQAPNHVLLDARSNRLYIVTVGQMLIVDAAGMKQISRIGLPDRFYRSACLNEATGRVFLLPGSIEETKGQTRGYSYPPPLLRIYSPANNTIGTARMPSDDLPPDPKLFHASESGAMAADPRKSEVYILSGWNTGLLIYSDHPARRSEPNKQGSS